MTVMENFTSETAKVQAEDQKEIDAENRKGSNCQAEMDISKRGFARESVFQLIIDPNDQKKMDKCKINRNIRKSLMTLVIALVVAMMFTMTALYIAERERRIKLAEDSEYAMLEAQQKLATTTTATRTIATTKRAVKTVSTEQPGAITPMIRPDVPGCVPVFDAHPLLTIPPEIQNLTKILDLQVENLYKMHQFKAASVAFSYRGNIWWSKHVGKLNFTDSDSPSPNNDTPYPIASITKLFTSFMLHKLYEEGKLRLDDPVKKHVPEFSVKNPFNTEQVTLRQLTCMMSGLPREAPCYPYEGDNFCPYNSSEMWKRIANMSLILPPDKNPSYSNAGYSVLGRTLERVAKESYDDWVKENIIKPLGMKNTGFDLLGNAHRFPVSSNLDGSIAKIVEWGWQKPAGGLFSTINDLNQVAKLMFELLNDTTVLHRSTARNLFKPAYLFNTGHGVGYAFEIYNSGFAKAMQKNTKNIIEYLIYIKSGAVLGYGSYIALIPELKFAAFSLVAHGGIEHAASELLMIPLQAIYPLEKVLIQNLPKYVFPPNPDAFVGNYSIVHYWPLINKPVKIYERNGVLFLKIEWLITPLSYDSPWVLVTGHFKQNPIGACEDYFLNSGLSNMKLFFKRPLKQGGRSPRFHVFGITTYGYAEFKRV
ncbi:beta-lactamase-like protein 2 isoform X2 [Rhopilema esculentum]